MRVAYLDLCPFSFFEDYSIRPKRYGGGRVFASHLKEFDEFEVFANSKCFDNIQPWERLEHCNNLTEEQIQKINAGESVCAVVPKIAEFDLLVHVHYSSFLNLAGSKLKELVWIPGIDAQIHPHFEHVLLYNGWQNPKFGNPAGRRYRFSLGVEIPEFYVREKENFIFQCSRHVDCFNSISIAKFAKNHGIKAVFAGPIADGYPLMDYIDGETTVYLGSISEDCKMNYIAKASIMTLCHSWPTPFSLSAVESLSLGTPVVASMTGFWPTLIQHGKNGFFAHNEAELLKAWESRNSISQTNCFLTACKYSLHEMLETVWRAFEEVLKT